MSRHNNNNNKNKKKKNGIPDRWLDYKAVGRRLGGTRFIAFKVPLKQSLNRQVPPPDAFGPWDLLDALNQENQELGLIIDLTFTTRYYQIQDLPESLLMVKILTAGHEVPHDDKILSFKRAVRRFLRDNADNDKLIGVHCTHGLNRTGYLICRYLIDVDGMDPQQAVDLFNSSRGHDIERQNYLDDLQRGRRRSNEGMEESEQEPMRGRASHRPSDGREERRPHVSDSWHHRSFPPGGLDHRSHHFPPHGGVSPAPPLLPPPPLYPPMGAPLHHPYRWPPPHSDSQWRRPPRSEELEWRPSSRQQDDRCRAVRRAPPPPAPAPLSRYTPRWTGGSNGVDRAEEEWAESRTRTRPRYPPHDVRKPPERRHRANRDDSFY